MEETQDTLEQKLAGEFTSLARPNAVFNYVKPDLDRVSTKFTSIYDGRKVPEGNLERAFNGVSRLFVKALYDSIGKPEPNVDGPEWYGNLVRDWAGKVSDQHLG